jgi:hypothetical protein
VATGGVARKRIDYLIATPVAGADVSFVYSLGWAPRPRGVEVVKGWTESGWVVAVGVPGVLLTGAVWAFAAYDPSSVG